MGYLNHGLICLMALVLIPVIIGDDFGIASHCSSKCGDVTIPYPFGIGEGCYYVDKDRPNDPPIMNVICDRSVNQPKPILGKNIPILNISLEDGEIRIGIGTSYNCYSEGRSSGNINQLANLKSFTISSTKNILVATGCDTYVWFKGTRYEKPYETGCMTRCNGLTDVADDCNGIGCCEASIPDGVTTIQSIVSSFNNHTLVSFNPCSAGYAVANDSFEFHNEDLTRDLGYYLGNPPVPVVFDWGIGTKNCLEASKDASYLCKNNTECSETPGLDGYRCTCKTGFTGNPYLPQGCKDIIKECKREYKCEKHDSCKNADGRFVCECPRGYRVNGTVTEGCIRDKNVWLIPVIVTAGIGGGIILLLVVWFLLYRRHEKRQLKQLREDLFRQNGGMILHQKLSMRDSLKIFTVQDLANATDKYNQANIIGRGGFGEVYKGMLPNNQEVAIKKSLKVDPNQVEQFINEVLVLSQINNRHVVRLLGCCLETEVPLLVYEFINNGTLYEHLHDEAKVYSFKWNIRLRIALEIADVLSYLHTTITTPIIHRDMKSMNILLDDSYTAKVADFGASRLVPEDHDQLATMVIGTLGYLDPEYMQTSELTEKSDVYSFGVVLIELLTREKALSYQRPEVERCLAMYFLLKMKENRLFDIVDITMSNDQVENEQIKEVANLARWCLKLKGEERPTMKEVAMELERIKRMASLPKHNISRSFDHPEDCGDHFIRIPLDDNDDGNTGGSKESDVHSLPTLMSPLGDGR